MSDDKIICLRFIGNLRDFFGEEICVEKNKCSELRSFIYKLIRERNLPYSLSDLAIVGENGVVEDDFCRSNIVYVFRRIQGGQFVSVGGEYSSLIYATESSSSFIFHYL
ncbi:MAG: hypothetical protein ACP5GI_01555 [Sulfolobales archaeon]